MLIAFAVPLALTFIVGKKKLSPADMGQGTEGQNTADSDNTEKVTEAAELKAFLILTKKENYGEHSILHHMNFELRWEI